MGGSTLIGIVGAGQVVQDFHLPILATLGDVRVEWLCDVDHARADTLAASFDIGATFTSVDACTDVDAVLVAIPVGERRPVVETAIGRGWNALCEKPFAANVEDHRWMIEAATARQVVIAVGFMRRWYRPTAVAKRLVRSQIFGPVESVIVSDCELIRRTRREGAYYLADPVASGGGILMEIGSHSIDQMLTICDAESTDVVACCQTYYDELELETIAAVSVRLPTGDASLALVVSRLRDLYSGIVFRCRTAELRVGLYAGSHIEIWDRNGDRCLTTIPAGIGHAEGTVAAFRDEWRDFLGQCRSRPGREDDSTGLLTTELMRNCYSLGARR